MTLYLHKIEETYFCLWSLCFFLHGFETCPLALRTEGVGGQDSEMNATKQEIGSNRRSEKVAYEET
jgi:hypothetical protein